MSPANNPLMPFEAARERLVAAGQTLFVKRPLAVETIDTLDCVGRVFAQDVLSPINVPPHDNSAMDGYAVRLEEVLACPAGRGLPVSQRIPAGSSPEPLAPNSCARIFTGAPIPAGADTVIMQERAFAVAESANEVRFEAAGFRLGEAVRRAGEDIALGSRIVARGDIGIPASSGLIASVGIPAVSVYRRIKVACFFTGDELTLPGQALKPGAIYNSNRFVLINALRNLGCEVQDLGLIPDTLAATQDALAHAASQSELIITSGGVSVGEEDHVKPAVQSMGELDLWQISMKPGKPFAYGHVVSKEGLSRPFIGLPGNPVSSIVTFTLLAQPFIRAIQGASDRPPLRVKVQAGFDLPVADKRREFLRASIDNTGHLQLFRTQSSGALTSLAHSDGLIDHPAGTTIAKGQWVDFLPFGHLAI